jgi:hypothetical protein
MGTVIRAETGKGTGGLFHFFPVTGGLFPGNGKGGKDRFGILSDEIMNVFGAGKNSLPLRGNPEFRCFDERDFLIAGVAAHFKVLHEKGIYLLAVEAGGLVRRIIFDLTDIVFETEGGEGRTRRSDCFPRSLDAEHIACGGHHQGRFGRPGEYEIAVVKTRRYLGEQVLFGILGTDGLEETAETGDIAFRGSGGHPVVHCADIRRKGAAPGTPVNADTGGIHIGAFHEIIDSPHGIPDPHHGQGPPQKEVLKTGKGVLGSRTADRRFPLRRIEILETFALADGIDGEYREPFPGQIEDNLLVWRRPVAVLGVPADIKNDGKPARTPHTLEKGSGDRESRTGFKNYIFRGNPLVFECPGNPGIERCSLRKRPESITEFLTGGCDIPFPLTL